MNKKMYLVIFETIPVNKNVAGKYSLTCTHGVFKKQKNAYEDLLKRVADFKNFVSDYKLKIIEERHGNIGSDTEWFSFYLEGYEKPIAFDIVPVEVLD